MIDMTTEQKTEQPTRTVVRCSKCGSNEVEVRAWVSPNLDNSFSMYCDGNTLEESETCYCHQCGEWTEPVFEQKETTPEEPYRCTNCGSTHVQHKAWVRTNKNNEYVGDAWEGEPDEEDCWCENCEEHHVIKPHREFMEDIDYWFAEELEPDDPEVITGLCECDYPSAEAYDAAVTAYWNALSDEQKIDCWKALTYDKRSGDK